MFNDQIFCGVCAVYKDAMPNVRERILNLSSFAFLSLSKKLFPYGKASTEAGR